MILSSRANRELLSSAYTLRAEYLIKPASGEQLRLFATRACASMRNGEVERIEGGVREWQHRYGLSPNETKIVRLVVSGKPRAGLSVLRGVAESTIKTQNWSEFQLHCRRDVSDVAHKVFYVAFRARNPLDALLSPCTATADRVSELELRRVQKQFANVVWASMVPPLGSGMGCAYIPPSQTSCPHVHGMPWNEAQLACPP